MTTWDDVQAAQDDVDLWKALLADLLDGPGQHAGRTHIEAELAEALELWRLRLLDYRLTCLAHPALAGPAGPAPAYAPGALGGPGEDDAHA